ncbi:gas vesicle protein [Streptomyces sp. CA-210063]|uniref:gas vesicle protein GvpO n=1 Tax=Streptomyces sp. CA-210063 TaxID=2801029 RepID=UPI00214B8B06|nr:gas vesicle protein [Streptomyces sp. CA-210063]UUU29661.1 gas vesicle protein [Streptomyces sp. CA-210063]
MSNTSNTSKTQSSRKSQKSDEPEEAQESNEERESSGDSRHDASDDRPSPIQVLRHARTQLAELTGMAPESVSSFEQNEDGWTLEVEVLEIARVPDTMSLLASYRVELDPQGELTGYRRVRRYERGRADPHRPGGR